MHSDQPSSRSPRTPLSPEGYIDRHNIHVFLKDVVSLLVQLRPERPLEFIADFFGNVLNGRHVLMREYEYINSCARNRWDFIKCVRDAFATFSRTEVAHACLLCGDEELHPFDELLHALLIRFYFSEFLERTAEVFCTVDTRACGEVNRNVLCLTMRQMMSASPNRWTFVCPPAAVFDQVLQAVPNSHAMINLVQMQSALIAAPAMREAILEGGGDPLDGPLLPFPGLPRPAPVHSTGTITHLLDEMRDADLATGNGARKRGERRGTGRRKVPSAEISSKYKV